MIRASRRIPNSELNSRNYARILYLRTFKDEGSDNKLIMNLATATAGLGKLVVLGSRDGETSLRAQWQRLIGKDSDFETYIEYVQSGDSEWRRLVHQEISRSDCVLLFMEPKGRAFPRLRTLKAGKGGAADLILGPPLQQSTGLGLLHEIVYLKRLRKVRRTIIVCKEKNVSHIRHLIYQSYITWPAVGNTFLMEGRRMRQMLPRFSALDMQVGNLYDAAAIIAFRQSDLKNPQSKFSITVRSVAERVCSKPKMDRGRGQQVSAILLGRSARPRRLPPDGARKIVQFSNVEDLTRIPPNELVEVANDEVANLLSDEACSCGCPYCKQALTNIFFYVRGLNRRPGDETILGRCQYCYGWIGIDEDRLIDI